MDFHKKGRLIESLNTTSIVRIPKKGEAEDLKDLDPLV